MTGIQAELFALCDGEYGDFNAKLIPSIDRRHVIGVRTPELRAMAKRLHGTAQAEEFLHALPHEYFEENQLHAFLLEYERDYSALIAVLDAFLPYVDNWATCDQMNPKSLGRNKEALLAKIREWLASGRCYTVRYAIGQLMRWYLDADFKPEYADMVAAVRSEEYYVRMMAAWYFATALAKQYDAVLPYFTERKLDAWTHNKAIQKAVESYRVSDEHKTALRRLKVKMKENID